MVVIDAVVRLIPGVLGSELSAEEDSFEDGLLEYPHYTRPRVFQGVEVPEVLLSGNHEAIRLWRRKESLRRTRLRRPDLLAAAQLTEEDRRLLRRDRGRGKGPGRGKSTGSLMAWREGISLSRQRRCVLEYRRVWVWRRLTLMDIIQSIHEQQKRTDLPDFGPGDTVKVHVKVTEGNRERIQVFEGVVLKRNGSRLDRDLYGSQDLARRGCRKDLSRALSQDRPDRGGPERESAPGPALLLARAVWQSGAHQESSADALGGRQPIWRRSNRRFASTPNLSSSPSPWPSSSSCLSPSPFWSRATRWSQACTTASVSSSIR